MKAIRRLISIIFYLFAGTFLMCWAMVAFVGSELDLSKGTMMGVVGILALVPLVVGAVISPGRRGREIGIVLLVASGWIAFTAISMGIMMRDPALMAIMPPDVPQSLAMFDEVAFGSAFTVAMAASGGWLVRRRRVESESDAA